MVRTDGVGVLQAALLGYQQQLKEVNAAIADVRRRLGQRDIDSPAIGSARKSPRKKHRISPEGRARIAAAQRRRWAAAKEAEGEVETTIKRSSKG